MPVKIDRLNPLFVPFSEFQRPFDQGKQLTAPRTSVPGKPVHRFDSYRLTRTGKT